MNRRRIVLALLALGVVPVAVEAQQARRTALVGVTMAGSPTNPFIGPLRAGLNELGWIEGNNMRLEVRYAEGQPQRYRDFMAEFVRLKVDVIVSGGGTTAARAAMQATTTIPIVVPVSVDRSARALLRAWLNLGAT